MNITAYRPFLDGEGSIREMREWETDSFARDAKLKDFRQHFSSYYTIHTFQADGLRVDWVTENGKVFQWYTQALPAVATQSGYTPCACRDCMDVTTSRNTNNPELCELCDDAGCVEWEQGSLVAYDCQRDDAYDGDAGTGHGDYEYHSGA